MLCRNGYVNFLSLRSYPANITARAIISVNRARLQVLLQSGLMPEN